MDSARRREAQRLWPLATALVVLAAGVPLLLYGLIVGRAPSISAAEARLMLAAPGSRAVLVDVRDLAAQAAVPLAGSASWPATDILAVRSLADVPAPFVSRPLLLLCSGGVRSAQAAQRLAQLGLLQAYSVRGGLQSWIAAAPASAGLRLTAPAEQLALVIAVFPIKLVYMTLALVAVVILWGAAEAALVALRWSMLFFLVGELFCWFNIVAFNEESLPLEFLHSWGMVACLGFLAFAIMEALDHGLIHYSDPRARCAFAGVCRGCAKAQAVPCLVVRLLKWTLPMLAISTAVLLLVPTLAVSYNTNLFGLTRNLMHPVLIQLYESRFAPVAAIVLLIVGWVLLLAERRAGLLLSKVAVAAALGHLGFAIMRLTLLAYFQSDLVWFDFWEEATELLLVATLIFALWLLRPETVRRALSRLARSSPAPIQ